MTTLKTKFEVGKYYKHSTGYTLAIRARADTTMWGECLVAESSADHYGLVPVGAEKDHSVNFEEITEEEWLSQFPSTENDTE